ncbi:acyl-CoA dehydrogenase family protein [Kocuria carniphila]|uniref:Acyl-CoA dehydrogenase family protein n=1 Tax=Kocuria carniphila TaxID=262208 RepID=A0ABV3V4Z5_9MICC
MAASAIGTTTAVSTSDRPISADTATSPGLADGAGEFSEPPTIHDLRAHFAPVFEQIAQGALEREQNRELAHGAVELLRESGFTKVRLPRKLGGFGASLDQLLDLLIDLAAADSNLPQALHGHFMFTEIHQHQSQGEVSDWWLSEVAAGRLFANALVELPPATGARPVVITPRDGDVSRGATVTGDKFYSTGSLFADYILVLGKQPGSEDDTYVVVDTRDPEVELIDDWNGIGQKLTASGTTKFHHAVVNAERAMTLAVPTGPLGFPFLWLILAATHAGIARAAMNDAAAYVAARRRTYVHGTAELPSQDPLVQNVVGSISAKASAARHIVMGAARELEAALETTRDVRSLDEPTFLDAYSAASVSASEASVAAADLSLDAANLLFETGGASSLLADKQLDRHWRNARVLASHTPGNYRLKSIGDYRINGTVPPLSARVRNSDPSSAPSEGENK